MFSGHTLPRFTLVLFFSLYLFFPSGFSTTDAWYYAASIKYCGEIFHPHHLLYNALGIIFSWIPLKVGFEVISTMKVLNALFAFLSLAIIQQIMYSYKLTDKHVVIITCLSGFSFSIMRFATENETYIVPLFFALLASFNYLKYVNSGGTRYVLNTGLWAAISVLFHQIYIFWWLGLLIGFMLERKKKHALLYVGISLIAPFSYLIAILIVRGGLGLDDITSFILGAFEGNARLGLSMKGILLSLISLIRSFVQVHGYIYNMVNESIFLLIPGIISLFFVFIAFLKLPVLNKINTLRRFSTVHIIIIGLQFIFAVFSEGNAEFMVMIPVLVFIMVPLIVISYEKFMIRIAFGMAVWNISYGLIPLHYKSMAPEQFLCDTAISEKSTLIIASDDILIKSMLYYQTGSYSINNITKSPAGFQITGKDRGTLDLLVSSELSRGAAVYTNCLDENPISRSSIIEGTWNKDYFYKYETILIKSWTQITGTKSVYRIKRML